LICYASEDTCRTSGRVQTRNNDNGDRLGVDSVDEGGQAGGAGPDKVLKLVAALEGNERGHSTDADLLGDVGLFVDVDLVELKVAVLFGELLEDGGDDLAGAAPGRPEVKDGDLVLLDDLVELVERVDYGDFAAHGGCGVVVGSGGEGPDGRWKDREGFIAAIGPSAPSLVMSHVRALTIPSAYCIRVETER